MSRSPRPILPLAFRTEGMSRRWVDIIKRAECSKNPRIDICRPPGIPFEFRVVVWSAAGMPAMDAMSDQNDAFVTAELVGAERVLCA